MKLCLDTPQHLNGHLHGCFESWTARADAGHRKHERHWSLFPTFEVAAALAAKSHLGAGGIKNCPCVAACAADDFLVEVEAALRYHGLTKVKMAPMLCPGPLCLLGTLQLLHIIAHVNCGGFTKGVSLWLQRLALQ